MTQKRQPIRVGDRLVDSNGNTWKVIETRPGGHVDLFDESSARFLGTYHKQIKGWTRA